MGELLTRAALERATWEDLDDAPGIYVVYFPAPTTPEFTESSGRAKFATVSAVAHLQKKWNAIQVAKPTSIVYFGKGASIRRRVRLLARFGLGRARNHRGGEWMWQIRQIASAIVLVQLCPPGKQLAFENWLLEAFHADHNHYPLANRNGPEGTERWRP